MPDTATIPGTDQPSEVVPGAPELASGAGVFPFVDEFEGSRLRRDVWFQDTTTNWQLLEPPGDRLGGRIYVEDGAVVLESHAACMEPGEASKQQVGMSASQQVWLDFKADLKQQVENIRIDVRLKGGEACNGRLIVYMPAKVDEAPGELGRPDGAILFVAMSEWMNEPLTLAPATAADRAVAHIGPGGGAQGHRSEREVRGSGYLQPPGLETQVLRLRCSLIRSLVRQSSVCD